MNPSPSNSAVTSLSKSLPSLLEQPSWRAPAAWGKSQGVQKRSDRGVGLSNIIEIPLIGLIVFILISAVHSTSNTPVDALRSFLESTAIIGGFVYLRSVIRVQMWAALAGVVFVSVHPLLKVFLQSTTSITSLLPIVLAPWILCMAHIAASRSRLHHAILTALILGLVTGYIMASWLAATLLVMLCVSAEFFFIEKKQTIAQRLMRWCVIAITVVAGAAAINALGMRCPGVGTTGPSGVSTALALVDRGAMLAARIQHIPEPLKSGGEHYYMGWTAIILCLIALRPLRASETGSRRWSVLMVMAMMLLWFGFKESLHNQLLTLFEYATLKSHVDTSSLQMLGVLMLPLGLLLGGLFLAASRISWSTRSFGIINVLVASIAVMLWWRMTPARVLRINAPSALIDALSGPLPQILAAFLFCCVAVHGVERIASKFRSIPQRFFVSIFLVAMVIVDLCAIQL